MNDPYNLQRFLKAQKNMYQTALSEIKSGKKTSHWMWYIFPQFHGLGRSVISQKYAIKSEEEAIAYFNHPVLGNRLVEITAAILKINNKTAFEILGSPDHYKLKSCMSLFTSIQDKNDIFQQVLNKYYD